jgi:hypothetical protein
MKTGDVPIVSQYFSRTGKSGSRTKQAMTGPKHRQAAIEVTAIRNRLHGLI